MIICVYRNEQENIGTGVCVMNCCAYDIIIGSEVKHNRGREFH